MENTSCLRITIVGMVITGVWLPNGLENKNKKVLYYVYAASFQIVMFLGIVFIELAHLVQVLNDIEKTVEACLLLLTHLAQAAKILTIWLRQPRIKKLLKLLSSPTFNREEPAKKAILEKTVQIAYMTSKTLAVASLGTGLMWGVFPILKPSLTVPLGYPYLKKGSTAFISMYVYQLLAIELNALGDTAEDFLAGGLMALAAAQIDLLCYELKNIGYSKNDQFDLNEDKHCQVAVNCVKFHQSIISFIKELDSIFGVPVFCQFAATCIILGLTAFKITISREPTEIMTMIFYLVCIICELLLYCYSGNIIMYKSEKIAEAAYSSGWINTSKRTQRILLLMTLRAQRPLSITAGKIFKLTLATFTIILKSSYSYFAVLNQKKE